jgi:hypothetical protein
MSIKQISMTGRKFATQLQCSTICALALMTVWPSRVAAQDSHLHNAPAQQELEADQQGETSTLIKIVRESTDRFHDVAQAEREGYALQFGCVSGPDQGAMGLHFINGSLVEGGIVDATRPQIVIYEPTADGRLKLIGADYLVFAAAWDSDKAHTGPPQLMGQLFHYFEAPNRFGLPAFYSLHVWAWKNSPSGAFVNWHPNVSCKSFRGQTTP